MTGGSVGRRVLTRPGLALAVLALAACTGSAGTRGLADPPGTHAPTAGRATDATARHPSSGDTEDSPESVTLPRPGIVVEGVVATHGAVAVDGDVWVAVSGPSTMPGASTDCVLEVRWGAGVVRAVWLSGKPSAPAMQPPPAWLCGGRLSWAVAAWRGGVWAAPSTACEVDRVDPATGMLATHALDGECQVTALADGGEKLWAATRRPDGSAELLALDDAGGVIARLPAPAETRQLAVDRGRVYGVADGRAYVVDTSTGRSTDLGAATTILADGGGVLVGLQGACASGRGGLECDPSSAVRISGDGRRTAVAPDPPRARIGRPGVGGVAMVPATFGTVDHRWWTSVAPTAPGGVARPTTWHPALLNDDAPPVVAVTGDRIAALRFPPLQPPVLPTLVPGVADEVLVRLYDAPDGPAIRSTSGVDGWELLDG